MPEGLQNAFASVLQRLRERITQVRERGSSIGEQNTKVALINPLLAALGWEVEDPDEVYLEYRRKPQDNPVDYALFLRRDPCLFVEAKALDADLSDRKWISQTLGYATVVGVEWCILTNGDEYRLYNAHAPVDAEEKLFRTVRLSAAPQHDYTVETLELLSKDKIGENRLNAFWKAHFVDRRVKENLEGLVSSQDPSLVRLLYKKTSGLTHGDIRNSLKRADLRVEFPMVGWPMVGPGAHEERPGRRLAKEAKRIGRLRQQQTRATHAVIPGTVKDLIAAGLIQPPLEVEVTYRKVRLTATIQPDGRVLFEGNAYPSLSTAGGIARVSVNGPPRSGRPYYQTNGWTFWKYRNPGTGQLEEIGRLRQRYLGRTH